MKSTIRDHAATCSGSHMPVHPGEILASRLTSVISVKTSPAPPMARLPRCTRCQSLGVPSSAEYWHMGETQTRFGSSRPRTRNGLNIGGGGGAEGAGGSVPACSAAFPAYHASTFSRKTGSRMRRFSCVMRRLRVMRLKANWIGSVSMYRSAPSNHIMLVLAARWRLSTPGRRASS